MQRPDQSPGSASATVPPRPFAWTKDANEILASIQRAKTKTSALTRR